MKLSILPRRGALLAAASILTLHHALAADTCTRVVTAQAGDTCATIAETAGITVSQFLRANPGVTTCSNLTTGTRYCVDPNFSATTTARAPAATSTSSSPPSATNNPGKPLEVTQDGQCGNGLTCLGGAFGDCCSQHGWCGSSADHCGATCQAAFGRCNGSSNPPGSVVGTSVPPTSGGGNAAVTATVYVTSTRVVSTTTTATVAQATATQIVRTTVPVSVTVTVSGGGGVATTTSTVVVTQHSLTFISSTVTTIKTITITDAKQCRTLGAVPRAVVTGVPAVPEMGFRRLAPMQEGVVATCETFYRVKDDDSCEGIIKRHNGALDLRQLYAWNQQLSGDCQGLWLGHWICVGA